MADFTTALRNLQGQRPLRRADGGWDVAIVLDRSGFSPDGQAHFDSIQTTAQQLGVPCQNDWSPPPKGVHTVCVVAHNNQDAQNSLEKWGEQGWLHGKYVMLFMCGESGQPPLKPEETIGEGQWGMVGSTMFVYRISLPIAALVLRQLLVAS